MLDFVDIWDDFWSFMVCDVDKTWVFEIEAVSAVDLKLDVFVCSILVREVALVNTSCEAFSITTDCFGIFTSWKKLYKLGW